MKKRKTEKKSKPEFIENEDYYFENGLMVLTKRYLEKRGYCCENNCRHCPYKATKQDNSQ